MHRPPMGGGPHRPPMGGMHRTPMGGGMHRPPRPPRPPMPPMGGGMWDRPPRNRGCCGCLFPVIALLALAAAGLFRMF